MTHKIWFSLTRHPWLTLLAVTGLFAGFPLLPNVLGWPARVLLLVLCLALGTSVFVRVRASPKPALFGLVAVLLSLGVAYGLLELVSWVYIRQFPVSADPFVMTERQKKFVNSIISQAVDYQVYSPSLAWTIGKSQTSKDGLYRSNADGFRADREYTKAKTPGKIRVLCFGDSYTHGDEASNQETWEHYAEQAAPNMEFLNFGVPGYGLTQAYLRYKEVANDFAADYVIIGCMTEDIKRGVNAYYPFRYSNPDDSPNAAAMPYAALDKKGELVVHPPAIASRAEYAAFLEKPLPRLKKMAHVDLLFQAPPPTPFLALISDRWESIDDIVDPFVDYALKCWNCAFDSEWDLSDNEALRKAHRKHRISKIGCQLFHRFALEVKKNGAVPIIVWFPSPSNLNSHNAGKSREYQRYFDFFSEKDLVAVDTLDWLLEDAGKGKPLQVDSVLERVHFSAPTNALVGRRIVEFIRNLDRESKPK